MSDQQPKKATRKVTKITERQAHVLGYLCQHVPPGSVKQSPTLRQMSIDLGFGKSWTAELVSELINKDLVEGIPFAMGSLVVTEKGEQVYKRYQQDTKRSQRTAKNNSTSSA